MKLKIERPDWAQMMIDTDHDIDLMHLLDGWFDENCKPINELLEGAVEVVGSSDHGHVPFDWSMSDKHHYFSTQDSHKAYLIGIEPIKKWQCPCGELAMFADTEDCRTPLCHGCAIEITKALGQK